MATLEGFKDVIRAKVEQERWTTVDLDTSTAAVTKRGRIQCLFHTVFLSKTSRKLLRPAADELDSVLSEAVNMIFFMIKL